MSEAVTKRTQPILGVPEFWNYGYVGVKTGAHPFSMRLEPTSQSVTNVHDMSSLPLWPFATLRPVPTPKTLRSPLEVGQVPPPPSSAPAQLHAVFCLVLYRSKGQPIGQWSNG